MQNQAKLTINYNLQRVKKKELIQLPSMPHPQTRVPRLDSRLA